jgi:hypothetical protein
VRSRTSLTRPSVIEDENSVLLDAGESPILEVEEATADSAGRVHRRAPTAPSEQPPLAGNALEGVETAVVEAEAGARDEVLDGGGDPDLVGTRRGCDPGADVDARPPSLPPITSHSPV